MSQPSQEGITVKKSENFDEWYTQMIIKSEMADYSPVSGCLVYRPSGYAIWENIQKAVDAEFKKAGIQDCYFPLFIPERLLKKEQEHVAGFSPEVAWVTEAGQSKLDERLAIRPTSETLVYDVIARWIRSWRDLPLRLNMWNSVVRWETRNPTPFLRGREFMWNEGHSVFATKVEADAERDQILGIYRMVTEEYLAIPGYMGKKTDEEKFAGAEATYSIEHLLPDGKAIQGPDWHSDGQRFAKAFEIVFLDDQRNKQFAWQNTYAISTREIGIMLAIHSDDKGTVVPPRLAEVQVVVVPIFTDESKAEVLGEAGRLANDLGRRFRTKLDDRDQMTPGRKFNEWELKGVPLRVEIGPRDIASGQLVLARRDTGAKRVVKLAEAESEVARELDEMNASLLEKARRSLASNTHMTTSYEELGRIITQRGGIVRAPWCGSEECERKVKEETGAKIINIPLDQHKVASACVVCGRQAEMVANFAKSY